MSPPPNPQDGPFTAGQVFSHYKLVRRLGRGGFGEVWEAVDQRFSRKVAIKFLLPRFKDDKKAIKRFKAEAVFSTLLTHPSIVQLLDTGQREDGAHYHVMEYLDGTALSTLLEETDRAKTTIGMPRAAHIAWQIAIVLHALHTRNIIHRDLKPHNLFLVNDSLVPGGVRVKILDFGIAKLADQEAAEELDLGQETTNGAHLGSPIIMAREQWRTGEPLTPAVDVYALGCISYKMLAGTYPFEGNANVLKIHHELIEPTPLIKETPSLPQAISDLVQRMLAKSPDERPTMAEVLDQLGRILGLTAAAAGPIVTRPTREIDAMIKELATGPTQDNSSAILSDTKDANAADEKPTDPDPQVNTSARHGQQVTSDETKARRKQRRQWGAMAGAGLLLCISSVATWRIMRPPHPAQTAAPQAPAPRPSGPAAPAASTQPVVVVAPTEETQPVSGRDTGSKRTVKKPAEAGPLKKVSCAPTEDCISGSIAGSDKPAILEALQEADINPCAGSLTLVAKPILTVRSAQHVKQEKQYQFQMALRGAQKPISFSGEVLIKCAKR